MEKLNKYIIGFLLVGTTLYASLAKPALPRVIVQLFDNAIIKMVFYALIVLLMTRNVQASIIVAVGFYATMNFLSTKKAVEAFRGDDS